MSSAENFIQGVTAKRKNSLQSITVEPHYLELAYFELPLISK